MKISEHNSEAEAAILGAVLLEPSLLPEVADILTPGDFFSESNRLIWECITDIDVDPEAGAPDMVTVTDRLRSKGHLSKVGGASSLGLLINSLPDVANVKHYAEIVKRDSGTRALSMAMTMAEHESDPISAIEIIQAGIDKVFSGTVESAAMISDVANEVAARAESLSAGDAKILGVPSGFEGLDRYITTLHPKEVYIIAARPSVGKTAIACNIAANVARNGGSVLFASLEMSKMELTERLISTWADVDTRSFRSGQFDMSGVPNDIERTQDAAVVFQDWKISIDDRSSLTAQQVRATARKIQSQVGLDLIIVDYLQLMSGEGGNRNETIGNISRAMKCMAKDLDVPVIILSQLSRLCVIEGRLMRPRDSDLRDSGNIEQDADKIIFLVRDKEENPRVAQMQLSKNRQGPIGDVPLRFNPSISKFEDGSWADHAGGTE